eukprot:1161189-Pelagomonas_calceolata.AAC.7
MSINESPVFLLLNPRVDLARKDLPVSLYETGALVSPKSWEACMWCILLLAARLYPCFIYFPFHAKVATSFVLSAQHSLLPSRILGSFLHKNLIAGFASVQFAALEHLILASMEDSKNMCRHVSLYCNDGLWRDTLKCKLLLGRPIL